MTPTVSPPSILKSPLTLHRCDIPTGETAKAAWLFPEIGTVDGTAPKDERLRQLAALMTHPKNGPRSQDYRESSLGPTHGARNRSSLRRNADSSPGTKTCSTGSPLISRIMAIISSERSNSSPTSSAYQSRTAKWEDSDESGPYIFDRTAAEASHGRAVSRCHLEYHGHGSDQLRCSRCAWCRRSGTGKKAYFPKQLGLGAFREARTSPARGKRFSCEGSSPPTKPIQSAGVIAAADNAYVLYLNNKKILDGEKWSELDAAPIRNQHQHEGQSSPHGRRKPWADAQRRRSFLRHSHRIRGWNRRDHHDGRFLASQRDCS